MYKWLQDALMLLGGTPSNNNIYNSDGALTAIRTLDLDSKNLTISGTADAAHSMSSIFSENSFVTTLGKDTIVDDSDHNVKLTMASVGILSTALLDARVKVPEDTFLQALLECTATGVGFDRVIAGLSVRRDSNGDKAGIEFVLDDSSFPVSTLEISTVYENGAGSTPGLYMTPTLVNTGTNEIRYSYPLQRHCIAFGDSGTFVSLNLWGIGAVATGAEGTRRKAVSAILSAKAFTPGAGTLDVTVVRASNNTTLYTKSIDTATLVGTGGLISEETIALTLHNNDQYYAQVTTAGGAATAVQGLTLTLVTI
jgi:hypothetical protein